MKDILTDIVAKKRGIVAEAKKQLPLERLEALVQKADHGMCKKFSAEEFSLIAECKLNSPAKGRLCTRYDVTELARIYRDNGASMLSVHTDPHFLGKNEDLMAVRKLVDIPILRKDFIIDEYQIYEARFLGVDAILLIVRILTLEELARFLELTHDLGMDALTEVHDKADIDVALKTSARFIGINNRNLQTFTTSIENTLALLPYLKEKDTGNDRVIISESGVSKADEAKKLRQAGCRGILVGEGLVAANDIAAQTRALKNAK